MIRQTIKQAIRRSPGGRRSACPEFAVDGHIWAAAALVSC
jgi:hypothetical protein